MILKIYIDNRVYNNSLDALHIAMAEQTNTEYFVTCDKGIIKKV